MDIGIYTFADVAPGGSHPQRLREHRDLLRAIERLGTRVAPRVKQACA